MVVNFLKFRDFLLLFLFKNGHSSPPSEQKPSTAAPVIFKEANTTMPVSHSTISVGRGILAQELAKQLKNQNNKLPDQQTPGGLVNPYKVPEEGFLK